MKGPAMADRKIIRTGFGLLASMLIFVGGCGESGTAPDTENPGKIGDPASGGKTPSEETFRDGVDKRNLPGLSLIGDTATLTVYVADRYNRYSGLPSGLNVHVASENGIATNTDVAAADDEGKVTFTLRTQGEPEDVGEPSWVSSLESTLGGYTWNGSFSGNGYPGKGLVSVLYYTNGEEEYTDANANGKRDAGEAFVDTPMDPYVDANANGSWDTGENYVDSNGDGAYTGGNNAWDSSKLIFRNTYMLVTGQPRVGVSASSTSISSGGTLDAEVVVCDDNYNRISSGSTIAITTTGGISLIAGKENITLPATAAVGNSASTQLALIRNTLRFKHDGTTTGDASFTVTVTWQKGDSTETLTQKYTITGP